MKYKSNTPEEYIEQIPQERQEALQKLRKVILDNLPEGFEEGINYDMIGYYVPHSIYPDGYHCNTNDPLPFINIASQKNSINIYHNGMYANKELFDWFVSEYKKISTRKLDMGKSCIRFKKIDELPYDLIGELCSKITTSQWIDLYEGSIKKVKK
jgi:uncharacterized protein YdhG (YjbR/CyaY superfamily)